MSTAVKTCTTTACSFNTQKSCAAKAITVAGDGQASCTTFVELDVRRPASPNASTVGACKHLECKFNDQLMCTAESVEVTDSAACATYAVA